jgi:hypothetical protein
MTAAHRALQEHEEAHRIAAETTFTEALDYERDEWPHWRIRRAFWKREDVPEEFRSDGPDPRVVLTMTDAERGEWAASRDAWTERRLDWLREAAEREAE